jgi:hypothetical protein
MTWRAGALSHVHPVVLDAALDDVLAARAREYPAPVLPEGAVVFVVLAWRAADISLRAEVPCGWLTRHGVYARMYYVPTAADVLVFREANPEVTMVLRCLHADPVFVERLARWPFLLTTELPTRLMHRLGAHQAEDGLGPEAEVGQRALLRAAHRVLVFSEPLAAALRAEGARDVVVVPDALHRLPPAPVPDRSRLAWLGLAERAAPEAALLLPALRRVLAARPALRVTVANGAEALIGHAQVDPLIDAGFTRLDYPTFIDRLYYALRPAVMLWPLGAREGTEVRGMSTALNCALAGAALLVSPRGLYRTAGRPRSRASSMSPVSATGLRRGCGAGSSGTG